MEYVILANPGHSRVYLEQATQLCLAELTLCCRTFSTGCNSFRRESIAGLPYYVFTADHRLTTEELARLWRLSFVYAVYEQDGGKDAVEAVRLLPVEKTQDAFDPMVSSILKYPGKTNEQFTRLLINLALYSSRFAKEKRPLLLDPVAGKGTTLFEGLVLGCSVSGVEQNAKAVHEAQVYFKKYLETARYKFSLKQERLSGEHKSFSSAVSRFAFAPNKESFKTPGGPQELTLVAGDARYTDRYFKKNSFHLLVGDLPYGIAHGNVTSPGQGSSLTRNPLELVKACLPAWSRVLKTGGAIALAWNTFVLPKADLASVLEKGGLCVLLDPPYDQLEHRVDQAIRRDVIVAVKQ